MTESTNDMTRDADYHDAHRDDPDEWEETAEEAVVRPSGMTVFSLRMPTAELVALRAAAKRAGVPVSDIIRGAVRDRLGLNGARGAFVAHVSVSASAEVGTIFTTGPLWSGGQSPVGVEYVEETRSGAA